MNEAKVSTTFPFLLIKPTSLFDILSIYELSFLIFVIFFLSISKPIILKLFLTNKIDKCISTYLRPIILTSITTFAGLFPLLLEKSLQAQFLKPMAVSVSFGLLLITIIILLMLPVFLVIVNRVKYYVASFFGKTVSYESVEPSALNLEGLDDEE